jgi:hypothetical protein
MSALSYWNSGIVFVAGIATLAIFSFLVKENGFYRFFEHLFIGISAGFGVLFSIKNFLWPKVLVPILGLDIVQYPDGSYSHEYNYGLLLYFLPMLMGLLYYAIYFKKYAWLAKIVIGFSLGASGALYFKGFFNQIIPQIVSSFRPLIVFSDGKLSIWGSLENCLFVFTIAAVMYYFFFSFRHGSKSALAFAATGRWLLMICFGAYFGSTVMARLALLVERLQFLFDQWLPVVVSAFV